MKALDPRHGALLAGTPWAQSRPEPLAGDASTRRYIRLHGGPRPAMIMDCGPDGADIAMRFLRVGQILDGLGLRTPEIFWQGAGLLLHEDFGDALFAQVIGSCAQTEADSGAEAELYAALPAILACLHTARPEGLPTYSATDMAKMIAPAFEHYRRTIVGDLGDPAPLQQALLQPLANLPGQSLSLRDFHAENLFWLPKATGTDRVGLIDYQDAMIGPAGYDLASLIYDARREVSPAVIETVQAEFAALTGQDPAKVAQAVAVLGAQRNLRILGIFVRLAQARGKLHYLDFLPRVWRYVEQCLAHPALAEVAPLVRQGLPPMSPTVLERLRTQCKTAPAP